MPLHRMVAFTRTFTQTRGLNVILKPPAIEINKCSYRFRSALQQKSPNSLKREKEKVRMYLVKQYIDYVKRYTAVLEARFPNAVKMYRVFSTGIRDFLKDLRTYIALRRQVSKDRGFMRMSRKDIELYAKMPSDMWKVAPVLILSALPFGNYIIFPLAFLKPKLFLCSHFWSIQQRAEFARQDLTERLKQNKPVFRALQAELKSIKDPVIKERWRMVLALMGSGVHPRPEEILACKSLFMNSPYQLSDLSYNHLGFLLKMHGLRKWLLRTNKLKYRAFLLMEMDKAIIREGGLDTLNMEALHYACFLRGLNSNHLSKQDMKEWLSQWLFISERLDKSAYSLILHCPILLGYNHPQNWKLIY